MIQNKSVKKYTLVVGIDRSDKSLSVTKLTSRGEAKRGSTGKPKGVQREAKRGSTQNINIRKDVVMRP